MISPEEKHESGRISQRFCFGMDAVLLSSFVTAKMGETVLDFCTGTGVIPILLKA